MKWRMKWLRAHSILGSCNDKWRGVIIYADTARALTEGVKESCLFRLLTWSWNSITSHASKEKRPTCSKSLDCLVYYTHTVRCWIFRTREVANPQHCIQDLEIIGKHNSHFRLEQWLLVQSLYYSHMWKQPWTQETDSEGKKLEYWYKKREGMERKA